MKKQKTKDDYIIATNEGRVYIKTVDFFKQEKIKETIKKLMESDVVKEIDRKNKRPIHA